MSDEEDENIYRISDECDTAIAEIRTGTSLPESVDRVLTLLGATVRKLEHAIRSAEARQSIDEGINRIKWSMTHPNLNPPDDE